MLEKPLIRFHAMHVCNNPLTSEESIIPKPERGQLVEIRQQRQLGPGDLASRVVFTFRFGFLYCVWDSVKILEEFMRNNDCMRRRTKSNAMVGVGYLLICK